MSWPTVGHRLALVRESIMDSLFVGVDVSKDHLDVLRPPAFADSNPAELARQVIKWALFSGEPLAWPADA